MSAPDARELGMILRTLNARHSRVYTDIAVERDGVGLALLVRSGVEKYLLKISREDYVESTRQSMEILAYLGGEGFTVPAIVPAGDGAPYFRHLFRGGERIWALFLFVDGEEPDARRDLPLIGERTGKLHALMRAYPGELFVKGKPYFIDSYVETLGAMRFSPDKTDELRAYGDRLWAAVDMLPRGFCHGDLHTGNMRMTASGQCYLFDFDLASRDFPAYDLMIPCDRTDYFHFDENGYDRVTRAVDAFYGGYAKHRTLTDAELESVYALIAIRHFQLQAEIIRVYGLACVDEAFMTRQYDWIMRWRNQCLSRGTGVA